MVVFPKEEGMKLCKEHAKSLCWQCILKKNGLEPPGYWETVLAIKKSKQEDQNVKK